MHTLASISIVMCFIGAGCVQVADPMREPHPSLPESSTVKPEDHIIGTQLDTFTYGKARIELGQTKDDVLAEIEKSEHASLSGDHRTVRLSQPETVESDRWSLSYGYGGGAAPGTRILDLLFKNGNLTLMATYPLP